MGGCVLAFALVGRFVLFADHTTTLRIESEHATVSVVRRGPFQETIPLAGTIVPLRTIYLDAIEGGRVESISLEAGSMVNEDDEIMRLANTKLLLEVMYREAELFQQRNSLRNTRLAMEQNLNALERELVDLDYRLTRADRNYANAVGLGERGLVSEQEFEIARDERDYLHRKRDLTLKSYEQDSAYRAAQIEELQASLTRMEDNLTLVKANLENLIIRAPVSGHLTSLSAEIGETKAAGERLGQIDVLSGFKVRAAVDEHYIARIGVGQEVTASLAGHSYVLVVSKVYPEVLDGRIEIDTEFRGEEPAGIRRGQTLRLRLQLGEQAEALLLARGSFYQTTGGRWVYVLGETGEFAVKRPVRLGRRNPDFFEVLDGLAVSEKVITSAYNNYAGVERLVLQ